MYLVRLKRKNGTSVEIGPMSGTMPKLGRPIEVSYRGALYRARVTDVAYTKPQGPSSYAIDVIDAEEL